MGFLSGLGKVLSVAAPIVAAPFTGGLSLAGLGTKGLGAIFEGVGKAASGISNARAADRAEDINVGFARDQQEKARFDSLVQAAQQDILNRKYQDNAYAQAADQRLFGGALQGMEDAHITRPGTVPTVTMTGGLRPSMLLNRAQVGADLEASAADRMAHPAQLPDLPTLGPMSQLPTRSGLDTALDWIGLGGAGGALATDIYRQRTQPPATVPADPSRRFPVTFFPKAPASTSTAQRG